MVEDFEKSFKTHLNYLSCLSAETSGIRLDFKENISKRVPEIFENQLFRKKISLVSSLKKSLDEEWEYVQRTKSFAQVACLWIPTKAYYLLFNFCCLIATLKTADLHYLKSGHKELHKKFKDSLKMGSFFFNKDAFNKVYTSKEITKLNRPAGYNLKTNFDPEIMINFILNKLVEMRKDSTKREYNLLDFISSTGRKILRMFHKQEEFTLIDFFHTYRIRTNYSDMDFLEGEALQEDFFEYYRYYYQTTMNLYRAFYECYAKLSKIRS